MTVISKNIDFFFIKFPFIFPIVYFLILNIFPEYEKSLIILTIFLLAEPHFSATWPLFLHAKNKEHIKFYDEKIFFKGYKIAKILPFSYEQKFKVILIPDNCELEKT